MAGGTWSTTSPPQRAGIYWNFMAAVSAAVAPGPQGTVAVIGTATWGPTDTPTLVSSQGQLEATFTASEEGTLHDGVLDAFDGFDLGGATLVYAYRAVASGAGVAATAVLKDSVPSAALTLTAAYDGDRPTNGWTINVQTNASNPSNKDLLIYENGVLLEQYVNITGGTNDQFAAAITAAIAARQDPFLASAAVTGATGRALANVVGALNGAGSFGTGSGGVNGNSGLTLTVGDITTALSTLTGYAFDAIAMADITDPPTQDVFNSFIESYNQTTGLRTFGVIGGLQGETLATAAARSYALGSPTHGNYNNPDLINLGVTDLTRLSDGTIFETARLAPRVCGAICAAGIARSLTGVTLTGWQVAVSPSNASYVSALSEGVLLTENVDLETVMISSDKTSLVNVATSPYADDTILHQHARNVAIDHFIENQMKPLGQPDIGALLQTPTGQKAFIGTLLAFLQALESQSVLEAGSTVTLDARFQSIGTALFLQLGINYIEAIERFFLTVRVG